MKITESRIPFNYKTIRITQSRIAKGLLAIPVSLIDVFPKNKAKVYVAFGESPQLKPKNFTPYESSSRECRIGGMRDFYERFQIKDGDDIVIQIIDDKKYRILPEANFENLVNKLEKELDKSKDEKEVILNIEKISKVTNINAKATIFSEYLRLSKMEAEERKHKKLIVRDAKEGVPPLIRKILTEIYEGKCQLTGFGFLMKNGKPYFEIHHIRTELGSHLKNLLVVCSNIHAQFTYANVHEYFDEDGWIRKVKFNNDEFVIKHIIDKIPKTFEKEIHYL